MHLHVTSDVIKDRQRKKLWWTFTQGNRICVTCSCWLCFLSLVAVVGLSKKKLLWFMEHIIAWGRKIKSRLTLVSQTSSMSEQLQNMKNHNTCESCKIFVVEVLWPGHINQQLFDALQIQKHRTTHTHSNATSLYYPLGANTVPWSAEGLALAKSLVPTAEQPTGWLTEGTTSLVFMLFCLSSLWAAVPHAFLSLIVVWWCVLSKMMIFSVKYSAVKKNFSPGDN